MPPSGDAGFVIHVWRSNSCVGSEEHQTDAAFSPSMIWGICYWVLDRNSAGLEGAILAAISHAIFKLFCSAQWNC
jgi:hypothetical protein